MRDGAKFGANGGDGCAEGCDIAEIAGFERHLTGGECGEKGFSFGAVDVEEADAGALGREVRGQWLRRCRRRRR